ncbi:1934_t:CDS:1 [Cetraspora pellucida]|uniref:1934_t:CDS:1 n=1 Tax=Cetraspora pellucida TaxID=1433469 RepID=A0A9N9FD35_9GLOM|nr:1934_t:CDS:1 [Cetraspora pellucida]
MVFIGKGSLSNSQLKKIFQVQKSKIVAVLEWLFIYNKIFKENYTIDKNALNTLPKSDIPKTLLLTTIIIYVDSQQTDNYTGYTQDPFFINAESDNESDEEISINNNCDLNKFITNNTINNANKLRPSEILHINDVLVTRKELTLLSLQKLIDKSNQQSKKNTNQTATESAQSPIIYIQYLTVIYLSMNIKIKIFFQQLSSSISVWSWRS